MDIRGSALTEEEKTGFSIVQAAQDERRLCLMRTVLDGRDRAAIAPRSAACSPARTGCSPWSRTR